MTWTTLRICFLCLYFATNVVLMLTARSFLCFSNEGANVSVSCEKTLRNLFEWLLVSYWFDFRPTWFSLCDRYL